MLVSLLRLTATVACVPLAALFVLGATGQAALVPALLAALAVVVAAVGLAAVWTNDLRLLADLLRLAGSGGRPPPVGAQGPFSLAGPLLGEVAFVSQTLGERAEEVNRLRRAEESILERLPDPLIVLAPDRGVRRTNEAARAAFGQDIAAVLRHPELRAAIDRALAAGEHGPPQVAEMSIPVPVPREVHATVSGLDSVIAGGRGALVVLSDRTRERAVERTRADFVANASHELRTPLASLIGFVDTLRGPGGGRSAGAAAVPRNHGGAGRPDEPADRRPAEFVAHRTDRASDSGG